MDSIFALGHKENELRSYVCIFVSDLDYDIKLILYEKILTIFFIAHMQDGLFVFSIPLLFKVHQSLSPTSASSYDCFTFLLGTLTSGVLTSY